LTVLRRLWGQALGGPSGFADQSMARMSAPSSPPPARNVSSDGLTGVTGRRFAIRSEPDVACPDATRAAKPTGGGGSYRALEVGGAPLSRTRAWQSHCSATGQERT